MPRDLTKWPRLLVDGRAVTQAQADEILVRTNDWGYLSTNDADWTRQVYELAEIAMLPGSWWSPDPHAAVAFERQIGALELYDLNNSRIASSWIGGPHGWCDWDGQIRTSDYNIGKWPVLQDVHEEWERIAAAFPYLRLDAQLVTDEGEGKVAVQWHVEDGEAHMVEPAGLLMEPSWPRLGSTFLPGGERGVSIGRLAQALERVMA